MTPENPSGDFQSSATIEDIQRRVGKQDGFTKLDLRDAYYPKWIKVDDEWKTAFKTRYGLFDYMVMF